MSIMREIGRAISGSKKTFIWYFDFLWMFCNPILDWTPQPFDQSRRCQTVPGIKQDEFYLVDLTGELRLGALMLWRVGNNLKPRLVSCCPVLLLYCDVFMLAEVVTFSLWAHAGQEPSPDIIDTNHTTTTTTTHQFIFCIMLLATYTLVLSSNLKLSYFEMFSRPSWIEKIIWYYENVTFNKNFSKFKKILWIVKILVLWAIVPGQLLSEIDKYSQNYFTVIFIAWGTQVLHPLMP